MDYEKKYKGALERAKKELGTCGSQDCEAARLIFRLFPELQESEDERIRKALIRFHKSSIDIDGIKGDDILAWLEKQGEQKPGTIDIDKMVVKYSQTKDGSFGLPINCQIRAYRQGINDALNLSLNIEKQGEQKPIDECDEYSKMASDVIVSDNDKPKFKVKYANSEYNVLEIKEIAGVTFYGIEDEPNHIDYVKADNCEIINGGYGIKENGFSVPTKPIMFSEQNPAWSEYDMSKVQRICKYLDEAKKYYADINEVRECMDWLKSLEDRVLPQPKQKWKQENTDDLTDFENAMMHIGESFFGKNAGLDPNDTNAIKEQANTLLGLVPSKDWSKEDETNLTNTIIMLKEGASHHFTNFSIVPCVDWLKSLKDRYTWKPSDEQMKALHDLNLTGNISYAGQGQELINLYNDLKKLKEE